MKKIYSILLFLFLVIIPISADSEKQLLDEALFESAITAQQKIAINKYFQNVIIKKQFDIKRLEDKLLISYGGKIQRDREIKEHIKNEIFILQNEINFYKIASNELR
jgi:hypothetical protein